MAIHCYFGLGLPKDKQKCAQQILGLEWYIKRLNLDEESVRKCAAGAIDYMGLKETLYKIIKFNGKEEIWNTIEEME